MLGTKDSALLFNEWPLRSNFSSRLGLVTDDSDSTIICRNFVVAHRRLSHMASLEVEYIVNTYNLMLISSQKDTLESQFLPKNSF